VIRPVWVFGPVRVTGLDLWLWLNVILFEGGLTHLSLIRNPLKRRLWGLGLFFGPLIWGPAKRGLNEEWARVGPWVRGQIDTSTI